MNKVAKYKYIEIWDSSFKFPRKKTKTFDVRNINSADLLGHILWSSKWRQYVFRTHTYYECDFSTGCNDDINDFIKKIMQERKNG